MKTALKIKIRERAGVWIIEGYGAEIIAPFPFTDAIYGSEEYEEAAEVAIHAFIESLMQNRKDLPEGLIEIARRICRLCNLPAVPQFSIK